MNKAEKFVIRFIENNRHLDKDEMRYMLVCAIIEKLDLDRKLSKRIPPEYVNAMNKHV